MSEKNRLPEIAIVGMGCLFPESPSPEALWQHVLQAKSTVEDVPADRWYLSADKACADTVQEDRVYSQKGCFIHPESLHVDNDLFDIEPDLLAKLDPLFQVLFHAAGAALKDAGDFATWNHDRTGVILGNLVLPTETASALSRECLLKGVVPHTSTDSLNLYAAGMPSGLLAQALHLGGTSFTLDAACASSLYALKMAMDELQSGRADVMLTGGVSRPDAQYTQMGFSQLRALSKRGKSAPFDALGDGLLVGEGSGVFVLKRLDDALKANNPIYGVIRGVGLSNDLSGKLLAPSSEGQLRAMRAAYAQAAWSPSEVELIECHATGTPLGDAVEFASLKTLWADSHASSSACVLGSVKSNIGHTLTAAGSAAMVKVLKAMQQKILPPTVNFKQASPDLGMEDSPFDVLTQSKAWDTEQPTRKAAISAFGFGGINAHVLIEEYVPSAWQRNVLEPQKNTVPISIVGIAAQVGQSKRLDALSRCVFSQQQPPLAPSRAWHTEDQQEGYFISEVKLAQATFRIPPKEMEEMLPQQLLMLQLAHEAWKDAGLEKGGERTGVYVGLGLDMNSTNFHLRWAMAQHADGLLSSEALQHVNHLLTPALNANRTMGALGSVVASRIARELGCGGPSFTLSSEGASGLHALATALHALEAGEIDTAIVGAVDMQADVRVLKHRQNDELAAEGGVVFVLRRANVAAYGQLSSVLVQQKLNAVVLPAHVEVMPSFHDCWGHVGAADGLFQLYGSLLCMHQHRLPASAVREQAQYWLHDRAWGSRQAQVMHQSVEGSQALLLITESAMRKQVNAPLGEEQLFVFAAPNPDALLQQLRQFEPRCQAETEMLVLASSLFGQIQVGETRAALVARSLSELLAQLSLLCAHLEQRPQHGVGGQADDLLHICARDRVFYQPCDAQQGKLAFVFPGSGNHFHGMGRDVFLRWPHLLDGQEKQTKTLATQFQADYFWHGVHSQENHTAFILAHVALGIALSDVLTQTDLAPQAAIPHSLGETVSFFSLGVWHERDEMLRRMLQTKLFTHELHSEGQAARRFWQLEPEEKVAWVIGVVDVSAAVVRAALVERCYLLIVNTPSQCVIGGQRGQVEKLVSQLGVTVLWLDGVSIAHTPVVAEVADDYRALHAFSSTQRPEGVAFYSDVTAKPLWINAEKAAKSRLDHALYTLNYPATIEQAYADGVRTFIEVGPGRSCTHMIETILAERPYMARAICHAGEDSCSTLLRTFASLFVVGLNIKLDWLYSQAQERAKQFLCIPIKSGVLDKIVLETILQREKVVVAEKVEKSQLKQEETMNENEHHVEHEDVKSTTDALTTQDMSGVPALIAGHLASLQRIEVASALAHQSFLSCSQSITENILSHAQVQMQMVQNAAILPEDVAAETSNAVLNREQCMEFAVGSIAAVFGDTYREIDQYPVRVRLPDEPLMLVDEVVLLEAEANSMSHGRIVTHHHVGARPWYLDQGHIPVCIAVESGQADLMLAAYLGIDFLAKGKATYRLLDAAVVFHADLPTQGQVIEYDIHVDRFFEHEGTWFMNFHFEGSVDGQPLISMQDGCAGFFSQAALDAGEGIKLNQWEKKQIVSSLPQGWQTWVSMQQESYDEAQLNGLRAGDLVQCFGADFSNRVRDPLGLPSGRMNLVHRVRCIEPEGGRFGLGRIVAEADIAADDWFLTCHFVDDKVMPGTLMYECCNHTLRIFLMRMGWISERDSSWWGPIKGVQTRLKCRGQVLDTTKVVSYEIVVKEMGYHPEPYAIVEANMYADSKFIVRFDTMSIQLNGSNEDILKAIWQKKVSVVKPAIYDKSRIVAFCEGKPSEAFGDRYQIFDHERKIARLPRDPYAFLDRITAVSGEPWCMEAGASAQAQYDVPVDAWYFAQNRQASMSFAVLLEIALQPCGWLAAYVGSALTSDVDLRFRNLGGKATQYLAVTANSGTLTIDVTLTRVSSSAGMIIQSYTMAVRSAKGLVYEGTTDFGFFSKEALAQQVGVAGAALHDVANMPLQAYPMEAPYPDRQMRMQDHISLFQPEGGPAGLGLIRGYKQIDANEWFFKAHFYEDPVNPGSLGLEAMMQLLKVMAAQRWNGGKDMQFQSVALHEKHEWIYRGQVVPHNKEVIVEAWLTEVDDDQQILWADGLLQVDGKVIYQMKRFSLQAS
ncbi:MAG: beta-ketoacyl synthase N-terminal-like domain-containing protein [Mariprofundaceae bacterium]|nr:beta-ketoacyl synthase N-terminal-like domain-containing protein [Mariprofundaceae bacterium]